MRSSIRRTTRASTSSYALRRCRIECLETRNLLFAGGLPGPPQIAPPVAPATNAIYTGEAGDNSWTSVANWVQLPSGGIPQNAPGVGSTAILKNVSTTLNVNTSANIGSVNMLGPAPAAVPVTGL